MSTLIQIRNDLRALLNREDLSLEELKKLLKDKLNELDREVRSLSYEKKMILNGESLDQQILNPDGEKWEDNMNTKKVIKASSIWGKLAFISMGIASIFFSWYLIDYVFFGRNLTDGNFYEVEKNIF
jgi:hypothetical protein